MRTVPLPDLRLDGDARPKARAARKPSMMKLSITAKLFAAVLSTAMAVALAMGAAAHFNLKRGFLGYLNEQAVQRLDLAVPGVTAGYQRHGSWQFLRDQPDLWYRLLRPQPPDDADGNLPDAPGARPTPSPGELTGANRRFTLFDADRQRVAGLERWSPDAVERAIVVQGRTVGWLAMSPFQSVSSAAETRFADGQARASWAVGLGAVLLAAGVALWASRVLLKPVQRVAAATHRLAAGEYGTRVDVQSHDEVGQLAKDFNRLAHSLQRNEEMRREFMADISHELRTPLGVLHGELEALEDGVRRLDAGSLRSLQGEVATLTKLVNDLYDLSLADVGALAYRKSDLDIGELLRATAAAFGERLAGCGLRLELRVPPLPVIVFGDERRLQQLFNNLFENSCRYTDAGGLLRVSLRTDPGSAARSTDGEQIVIEFSDSAPGVSAEQLARIFDRFFRGEVSRNRGSGGAGLGLSISKRIVEAHDGQISAQASPLGGLCLSIRLPRVTT